MAPITSCYLTDVIYALKGELERALGVGQAEDFPTPEYLQVKSVRVGNPTQQPRYSVELLPAVELTFYQSNPNELAISGSTEGFRMERIMVWMMARFNPTLVGMPDGYTTSDFLRTAHASMETFVQRVAHVLREFTPGVSDDTWKWASNSHRVDALSFLLDIETELNVYGRGWMEYLLESSRQD